MLHAPAACKHPLMQADASTHPLVMLSYSPLNRSGFVRFIRRSIRITRSSRQQHMLTAVNEEHTGS
jgi:hypothetical protein